MMGINDSYIAFCIDEAGSYIEGRLAKGDEILKEVEVKSHYSKPSDLYKDIMAKG